MNEAESTSVRRRPRPRDVLELLRPHQWVKNIVVFAGPAAGLRLFTASGLLASVTAFASFCLAASGAYAINDAMDREADARHPVKRNRPVARGAILPGSATAIGGVLAVASIGVALLAGGRVALVVALYFGMTIAYSLVFKQKVLLDVIVIATGFVLRAWAGSLAAEVYTSKWLVACMFTLCLFLGFGKRRCEVAMMGGTVEGGQHRKTLMRYTPDLLNHLITVSAGIAVITFLLYTLEPAVGGLHAPPFRKEHLFYTLPIVVYGVFRYAMLTESGVHSGPTEIVLKDKPLLATIVGWAVCALLIAYRGHLFGPGG